MIVLVTGASGEIGAAVLTRLASVGDVRVLARREGRVVGARNVAIVRGDLERPASLAAAVAGVDAVVHMAAVTHAHDPKRYEAVNVAGTRHLVEAASRAGVARFVHLSTRALGEAGGAYAASKARAEDVVRGSALASVILRPAEVYGAGGRDAVTTLARSLLARSFVPILGDGGSRLSPVHADDVAKAIAAAVVRPVAVGRTYVLAGPEELSYLELVERLEQQLGLARRRRIFVPLALARPAIRLASRLGLGPYVADQLPRLLLAKDADVTAARRDLGFAPRALEQGLGGIARR